MKTAWLKIFFLIVLCGFSSLVSSQNYHIERHLTIDDGLPSNETYSTFQTDDGDLWICTDRGLARYNGISMRVYDEGDGLADNVVFKSYEDYSGRIWLITAGGLSYLEGDSIVSPEFNKQLTSHEKYDYIKDLYVYDQNFILLSLNKPSAGLFRIINGKVDFRRFWNKPKTNCWDNIFYLEKKGEILLEGMLKMDPPSNCIDSIYRYKYIDEKLIANIKFATSMQITQYHNYFSVGTNGYFSVHNKLFIEKYAKPLLIEQYENSIMDVEEYKNDLLLGFEKDGLWLVSGTDGSKLRQYLDDVTIAGIQSFSPNTYYITTLEEGVFILNLIVNQVYNLSDTISLRDLAQPVDLYDDTMRAYVNGHVMTYSVSKSGLREIGNYRINFDLSRKLIAKNVCWNRSNRLRFKNFVVNVALKNEWYKRIDKEEREDYPIHKWIHISDTDYIALGRSGGLKLYKGMYEILDSRDIDFTDRLNTAHVISDQSIWIGGFEGLYKFRHGDIEDYRNNHHMFEQRIEDIKSIRNDVIVIGTLGSGIAIYNEDYVMAITTEDGLISNLIHSILVDSKYIWVGTNYGLNRIEYSLDRDDSICIKEVIAILDTYYINDILDNGNTILVQSGKGFIEIDKNFNTPQLSSRVSLQNFVVNGSNRAATWRSSYSFSYRENNVNVEYRINELLRQGQQAYKYRLLGLDEKWEETQRRKIGFNSLEPGQYRLEMKARNSYGKWSEEPQWLEFEIRPHFTQTAWFRYGGSTAMALFLGGMIFVYVRNRHRKLARENYMLNSALNSLKLEMNPHFIFNALNSIQYFIANNQRREANMFLARFATLIRNVLNATDQKKLNLTEEINKLKDYLELERIRMHRHFHYNIIYTNYFDHDKALLPPMLIQPLVENAIWHGISELERPGEIEVSFTLEKNYLTVLVEDNGKGMMPDIERAGEKKSRGLRNIKSRLELMSDIEGKQYSMSIDSAPGKGTRIELKIPQ